MSYRHFFNEEIDGEEREVIIREHKGAREWLNDELYNEAFDSNEKSAIVSPLGENLDDSNGEGINGKIFLLSEEEATNSEYGFNVEQTADECRECKVSNYAKYDGEALASNSSNWPNSDTRAAAGWWLLRTSSSNNRDSKLVKKDGSIDDSANYSSTIVDGGFGVRPALHIDLSSNVWEKAGEVTCGADETAGSHEGTTTIVDEYYHGDTKWTVTGEKDNYTLTIDPLDEDIYVMDGSIDDYKIRHIVVNKGVKSIPNTCSGEYVEDISIAGTVEEIEDYAFENYSNLKTIIIPDGVKTIGAFAFEGCTSLSSISIPESVRDIGNYAFASCQQLKSITLPEEMDMLGCNVFENCYSLESVVIPKGIEELQSDLFHNCCYLKNIVIPEGVKSIEDRAFCECVQLKNVDIPDSVSKIGCYTFFACRNLINADLPDNVLSIGEYSFCGCSELEKVKLPLKITTIENSLFAACTSLSNISIPDSVTMIKDSAFAFDIAMEDIFLPNNIESIGDYAFEFCNGTSKITIPSKTKTLGEQAFFECKNLNELVINSNGLKSIGRACFSGCENLEVIHFPKAFENLTTNEESFKGCKKLKELKLPEGVKEIGEDCFTDCSAIEMISLPDSLETLSYNAFVGCDNITEMRLPQSVMKNLDSSDSLHDILSKNGKSGIHVILSDNVKTVYGFYDCALVTDIVIPDGVTTIDEYAFQGCTGLKKIPLSDQLTSIGEYAFSGCENLEEIFISDNVNEIGEQAFENCPNLKNVTISQYVVDNYKKIFEDSNQKNVNLILSDNVKSIPDNCFSGCRALNTVDMPDTITSIGDSAFEYCTGLVTIPLYNNITSIGKNAFKNCSNLETVNIPNGISSINEGTFGFCSSLGNVSIPNNVKEIGSSAFCYCSSLTNVTIPESVKEIGSSAFSSCSNLRKITLPSQLGAIESETFKYCTGLTGITIPGSVKEIGDNAFSDCSNLKTITIPKSVTAFGSYIFNFSYELTDIYYTGSEEEWNTIAGVKNLGLSYAVEIHYNQSGAGSASEDEENQGEFAKASVSLIPEKYEYTGKPIKAYVNSVFMGSEQLKEGTDYTVAYENNINVGDGKVILTGIGKYKGKKTVTFKIMTIFDLEISDSYNGVIGEEVVVKAHIITSTPNLPLDSFSWSLDTADGKIGKTSTTSYSNGEYTVSVPVVFDKVGKYTLHADFEGTQKDTVINVKDDKLTIAQPPEGENYAFAGDIEQKKTFTMTLKKVDQAPDKADFKFSLKKSDSLISNPSKDVSSPDVEVEEIKKVSDRNYTITFSYKPDETGLYGLTVKYKDSLDDTELMVYDSNILEKLDQVFNRSVKSYYDKYNKRVKAEIKEICKEEKNKTDFVYEAQELKNDNSNALTGTGIGDISGNVNTASLDLCAYEALARCFRTAEKNLKVKFDEVDNDTARDSITQKACQYIYQGNANSKKEIPLDSKVTIGGKDYSVKATWNIWYGSQGNITLYVQDQSREERIYVYNFTNLKNLHSVVADYIDSLKELEKSSQKYLARAWYEDLVDLLGCDPLKEFDSEKDAFLHELADDMSISLEKHGILNVLTNNTAFRKYHKKVKDISGKLGKPLSVFKKQTNPKQNKYTSFYEIDNLELNSADPGYFSSDIYDLLKKGDKAFCGYLKEYFTTGTIKDLEVENLGDTVKNGVRNIFKCPVSITVYNPSGKAVGYVGEDDIWFIDPIYIEEEGDAKIIYTPKTKDYRFEVKGTDYGLVSYSVEELTDGTVSNRRLNYYDMPVEKGSIIHVKLEDENIQAEKDVTVTCGGDTCQPNIVNTSSKVSVSVLNDSDRGTVTGSGNYIVGDMAVVTAEPSDGYIFTGWYEGNSFKTLAQTYEFEVRGNKTLKAAYAKKPTEEEVEQYMENNHDHEWSDWKTVKEATCKEAGLKKRSCSICENEESEEIPKTDNHTFGKWVITKEATIDKEGEKKRTCSVCGKEEKETIDKLTSSFSAGIKISDKNAAYITDDKGGVTYQSPKNKEATDIVIPDSVKIAGITYKVNAIGDNAFANNKYITNIVIGNNVSIVGKNAFANCNDLVHVQFKGKRPQFYESSFKNVYIYIYYPPSWDSIPEYLKDNLALTWIPLDANISYKLVIDLMTFRNEGVRIAAGRKVQQKPRIYPENAYNKKLKWKSSNTKVATVNSSGLVTTMKNAGGRSAIITATATDGSGESAYYRVRVMKGIVKKIKISGKNKVKAGKALKLKAKVKATKGANKKLHWTSSNTRYATVNGSGKVFTRKAGKGKKVKITAMATDGSGKKASKVIKIK